MYFVLDTFKQRGVKNEIKHLKKILNILRIFLSQPNINESQFSTLKQSCAQLIVDWLLLQIRVCTSSLPTHKNTDFDTQEAAWVAHRKQKEGTALLKALNNDGVQVLKQIGKIPVNMMGSTPLIEKIVKQCHFESVSATLTSNESFSTALPQVTSLILPENYPSISDILPKTPNLTHLILCSMRNPPGNQTYEAIETCASLTHLKTFNWPAADRFLQAIKKLKNLRELELEHFSELAPIPSQIKPWIELIQALPLLNKIKIPIRHQDIFLACCHHPNLEQFSCFRIPYCKTETTFSFVGLGDEAIDAWLACFPAVKELHLAIEFHPTFFRLSNEGLLKIIKNRPELERIAFHTMHGDPGTPDETWIKAVATLKQLKSIYFYNSVIKASSIAYLLSNCSQLEHLSAAKFQNTVKVFTSDIQGVFDKVKNCTLLKLETDEDVALLATKFPNLEYLRVETGPLMTGQALQTIASNFGNLTGLIIIDKTGKFTNADFKNLGKNKPHLSTLKLDCSKLTHIGVKAFISDFMEQLSVLDLGDRSLNLNPHEVQKAMKEGGKFSYKFKNKAEEKPN